jgi:DHA2 family multidrug resistance protein
MNALISLSPAPAAPAPAPARLPPYLPLIVSLALAAGVEAFTSSAVSLALPRIAADFSASPDEISWAVTLYLAAFAVGLPLTAWLADGLGQKKYLGLSMGLYALASAGCMVAPTLPVFLGVRLVQGFAGAAFLARAIFAFTKELRPPVLMHALFVFIAGFSLRALGLPVGGYLVDHLSWRWLFAVPVAVLGLGALPILKFSREIWPRRSRPAPDFAGLVLLVAGLGALLVLLFRGERDEWFASPVIVALAAVAALSLPMFFWRQSRRSHAHHVFSLAALRYRGMGVGVTLSFLAGIMLIGGVYVLPQFFLGIVRCDAYRAGWLMSVDSWALMAGLAGAAWTLGKVMTRSLLTLSGALFTAAMLLFAWRVTSDTPVEALYLPIVLHGIAVGLALPPIGIFSFRAVAGDHVANSEGRALHYTARQIGGVVAVALAVVMLDSRATVHSSQLAEHVTASNAPLAQTLALVSRGLVSRGLAPASATAGARAIFGRIVAREANVLAFRDLFFAAAALGFVVSALSFGLPKFRGAGRSPSTPAAAPVLVPLTFSTPV